MTHKVCEASMVLISWQRVEKARGGGAGLAR
jgi:hypothetical protein